MKFLLNSSAYFLISFALMFIAANAAQAQTEKQILKIRAEVAAIEKGAAKFTKTTKDVEGISLEGAEATYFYSGGDLKKITTKMFGETYNATGEFYYQNGELIFAFVKRNHYDTQIGMDPPPKVTRIEEQRFYFANGELIRLLVGKNELKAGIERYVELKDEIVDVSTQLKNFQ